MLIAPKDWREFQHYSNRCPPWIRLHRKLLDNMDFHRLPVASRALAPMLWLLASESVDGVINGDVEYLAFRLRMKESEVNQGLSALMERGFFVLVQDASRVLATGLRDAPKSCPETEALHDMTLTETETEGGLAQAQPPTPPPEFDGSNESAIPARAQVVLSKAWSLPEAWGNDAEALGWKPGEIIFESEKFRQYYVAGKGSGTRRSIKGWRQAWSNWLANAEKFKVRRVV